MVATALGAEPVRIRESFDTGWRFQRGDHPAAAQPAFDDAGWTALSVPHDWSIEGPYDEKAPTGWMGGFLPTGHGWYRKHFTLQESMRGRKITIQFDGVYMNSDVWINGQHVGNWPYGYTTFAYDLTPYLKQNGEPNVLAVRVDNSAQPNSRWYTGSGIYRHVWLTATHPVHVAQWGTQVMTPAITEQSALARVLTRVANSTSERVQAVVRSEIFAPDGVRVAAAEVQADIPPRGEDVTPQDITVPNPQRWDPSSPNLYRLRTTILRDGKPIDEYDTAFGIRSVEWTVDRGLVLNGKQTKIFGACVHHDGGMVGAAVPEALLERRLKLLQSMGVNAVRAAHNPMATEFYELCDRLGLLVMDESFDEWTMPKRGIVGYSRYFNDWYERDLVAMLRRNRNHPSIVIWSVGNEIYEQREPFGADVLRPMVEICHREDPTRPVTAGMDLIYTDEGYAPDAFSDLLDVVGYNYVDRWLDRRERMYEPDRIKYPQRRFVGTEGYGIGGVRGRYLTRPVPPGSPERPRYLNESIQVQQLWKFALTHDYDPGYFIWAGIDFHGEQKWPRVIADPGAMDTCGFPKNPFYLYQSIFTSKPMLHLQPHWNWPGREGEMIPVVAYTNCDVVELKLNGRSMGVKAREFPRQGAKGGWESYEKPRVHATTSDLHLQWDVPYQPGVIQAIGWKDGKIVLEQTLTTTGAPAAVTVEVDRPEIRAEWGDIAHVSIGIVDANGHRVPGASNVVRVHVEGAGEFVALDSGDPDSHQMYHVPQRAVLDARALALVRATGSGEVKVTVTADGLRPATATFRGVAVAPRASLITK